MNKKQAIDFLESHCASWPSVNGPTTDARSAIESVLSSHAALLEACRAIIECRRLSGAAKISSEAFMKCRNAIAPFEGAAHELGHNTGIGHTEQGMT